MKRTSMYAAFLLIAATVFGAPAMAQDKDEDASGQYGYGRCVHQNIPGLTEKQHDAISKLRTEHQKKAQLKRAEIAEKRARLNTLRLADNPDMAQINKTIDEIAVMRADLMKEREAHLQAIRSQLNEEQKAWFNARGNNRRGPGFCDGSGPRHRGGAGDGFGRGYHRFHRDFYTED